MLISSLSAGLLEEVQSVIWFEYDWDGILAGRWVGETRRCGNMVGQCSTIPRLGVDEFSTVTRLLENEGLKNSSEL